MENKDQLQVIITLTNSKENPLDIEIVGLLNTELSDQVAQNFSKFISFSGIFSIIKLGKEVIGLDSEEIARRNIYALNHFLSVKENEKNENSQQGN